MANPVPVTYSAEASPVRGGRHPAVMFYDNFERNNFDAAQSFRTVDTDGVELVRIKVRPSRTNTESDRWLTAFGRVSGMRNRRPKFELFNYSQATSQWHPANRPMFSEDDGATWQAFSSVESYVGACKFRHNQPFTTDSVLIAEYWVETVSGWGGRIAGWQIENPTKVFPTPTASTHVSALSTWPAQDFIAADINAVSDIGGRPIPATPLYGFVVDDQTYSGQKQNIVITGGIHAGEDDGQLPLWQIVDVLLSSRASAQSLRSKYRFVVYPMINAAGRWAGCFRGTPGVIPDPNREWLKISSPIDCVQKCKAAILSDTGGTAVFGFDFHSTNSYSSNRWSITGRTQYPLSVAFRQDLNSRLSAYSRSVDNYGVESDFSDPSISLTIRGFFARELGTVMPMTCEVNQLGAPLTLATFGDAIAPCFVDALDALQVT